MQSITFVVPALNEERALADTVAVIRSAATRVSLDHEIIVVDDGSTDGTFAVANRLAQEQTSLSVIRHKTNLGLGAAYKTGVKASRKHYLILVPADDVWPEEALVQILGRLGEADIIIPYIELAGDKSALRRLLSRIYTAGINFLFRLSVPYYNGIVVHRTDLIRSVTIRADDFSYQTEALVKLLRHGHDFVSVPTRTRARPSGRSKAFGVRNVTRVLKSIFVLFVETHFFKAERP